MSSVENSASPTHTRFDLVTAGHHFLLNALPLRYPDSVNALTTFVHAAERCQLALPEIDAVLLRCLRVMHRYTGGITPTLIDRYVSENASLASCIATFARCVQDVLRYRGLGDGRVQRAVAIITTAYDRPALTPRLVAHAVNVRLATLCRAFKQQTGSGLSEYIRDVRLVRAAFLLTTTGKSIKEVWASIGYNHASNFDHDFKKRFNMTPRQYRAQAVPLALLPQPGIHAADRVALRDSASPGKAGVLIVDDDEGTRTTLATYLQACGYSTVAVSSGIGGIHEVDRSRPDVMLLDYHLEDMSGLDCLRAVRQLPGGQRCGVTLFTADWDVFAIEEEIRALGATITSKLCDLEQVQAVVDYLSPVRSPSETR